ncbi:MAG: glycosyltransferase family 4 protein [Flavobacteriales bacterium]|nr:glycosyltransferase family 4 protein [Flavobacteriales bacterium]
MRKLKVCHIVNWYPNPWNEKEAIWTQRHINGLNDLADNLVYHIQVRKGKFKFHSYSNSKTEHALILTTKTDIWFLKEILTTLMVIYVLLFKIKRKQFDGFNFHITYPLLTYSRIIQLFTGRSIVITDHWSAYHFNFGVQKKLRRIQRIFKNKNLKFICVSEALVRDIESFSESKINSSVVPNVIDTEVFQFRPKSHVRNQIFMVSYWKYPKDPIFIFEVVEALVEDGKEVELVVGGFGPLQETMEKWVMDHGLSEIIKFSGKLNSSEIANTMADSSVFVHCSDYEVASVVCMEAHSVGCPIIASNVGGIPEYVNDSNGVLLDGKNREEWKEAIVKVLNTDYDREKIAATGGSRFSEKSVSEKYLNVLNTIFNSDQKARV